MPDLDPKELRAAFSRYMTGVTVVTTKTPNGQHVGFTANSFTSVSLDPPLLLVCPGKHLSSFETFKNANHFAVNILAQNQEAISNRFASSTEDRFALTDWSEDTFGSPVIDGVAAYFSCTTFECMTAGDHIILVGEVHDFQNNPVKGLGYSDSGYFNLSQQQKIKESNTTSNRHFAGAIIECEGHIWINETKDGLEIPMVELNDRYLAPLILAEHLRENGIQADIGQTYSVFHDPQSGQHYTFFRATAASLDAGPDGAFKKISTLEPSQFKQSGFTSMMQRFKSEINNQRFGLFIGDSDSGDVHLAPST